VKSENAGQESEEDGVEQGNSRNRNFEARCNRILQPLERIEGER
jgi:hypothetical protein